MEEELKQLTANVNKLTELVQGMPGEMQTLKAQVAEIVTERETQKAQQAQELSAQQRQEEQQALLAGLAEVLNEKLTPLNSLQETVSSTVATQLRTMLNPSNQPTRKTAVVPVVAATGSETMQDPRYLRLIQAEAELSALRRNSVDTPQRFDLAEEVTGLKRELGVA